MRLVRGGSQAHMTVELEGRCWHLKSSRQSRCVPLERRRALVEQLEQLQAVSRPRPLQAYGFTVCSRCDDERPLGYRRLIWRKLRGLRWDTGASSVVTFRDLRAGLCWVTGTL